MAPALAVVALGREPSPKRVVALTLAAVSTVGGLLISGTRTSFLVAVILLTLAGAWRFAPAVATSRLAIGCSIVVVGMAGLGYAGGVLNRLPTQDAAHVGVNFRLDEAKALLGMKADEVLVGQGIGGRFESKDVNGQPVTTGWAHSTPLWLLLKGGVLLALGTLALGVLLACTAFEEHRRHQTAQGTVLGLLIVLGICLLSLTLGRGALVEGITFLVLGASLIGLGQARETF